jgi:hypothetical protein
MDAMARIRYGIPIEECHSIPGDHFDGISFFSSFVKDGILSTGGNMPMEYPPTRESIRYAREIIRNNLRRKECS